jgi:predicted nucleic acid-binding protein
MAVFYLDTSAIVKRHRRELGTETVDELFRDRATDDRFFTSFLTTLEFTSAIHRLIGAQQLDAEAGREILAQFSQDLLDDYEIWPLNEQTVTSAVQQAEQFKLRSGDAIHLATALAVASSDASSVTLMVSSDRELCAAAGRAGLAALDPTSADCLITVRRMRAVGS